MTGASAAMERQRIGGAREALLRRGPAVTADARSGSPFLGDRRVLEDAWPGQAPTAAHLFSYRRALDMMCD